MKVSITLPSLFPDLLADQLEAIRANTSDAIDYEVLVVSPFRIEGHRVRWIEEREPRGNCAAHRLAYAHAEGDVIVPLTDDFLVQRNWLSLALSFFRDREQYFFPYACGLHQGTLGTAFGLYFPYFPVMSRRTIEAIGAYFPPEYQAHFGDADMAMRIWAAGGRCEVCLEARLKPIPPRPPRAEAPAKHSAKLDDLNAFVDRWKDVFGQGWAHERVRDFNLDIPETLAHLFLDHYTICHNDPSFRQLVMAYYSSFPDTDFERW